jgi:predicted metalloprotease with PDZ domain
LQLPVWNALYQVRDFSQYVNWVKAKNAEGKNVMVHLLDKSRWRIDGAEHGAQVEYEIVADLSGAYGAQLNSAHGFFNLGEILMYPVDERSSPTQIRFRELPGGWQIATALAGDNVSGFSAPDYDRLVDAPVEMGTFQESDFDDGGVHYRVVVDADRSLYDMQKVVSVVRRIEAATTTWMNDRPFQSYLFIYHFPQSSGDGGMEHMDSTAIDVNVRVLGENHIDLAEATAHEFFHAWNVKRIGPQRLEPVDYTTENYTRALWFSEGVTNTVQDYILLRAGFLDEHSYLSRLANHIGELERRPAHLTQSAEESSLDAWLEKYPSYLRPERSISYYYKGELLGVMLDLTLRNASHNAVSLRDLFQWMNQNYARQGRFFADSDGVRQAAETLSHSDLKWFFEQYVAGTEEIPWDGFFRSVGLRLARTSFAVGDPGFAAVRSFEAPPVVIWIDPDSEAQHAGLEEGDSILQINGQTATADFEDRLAELPSGSTLQLKVRSAGGQRELHWKMRTRQEVELSLKDVEKITPQQKARRAAWLNGETQAGGDGSR